MRELKASTKAGQRIIEMGENCIYYELYEIYGRFGQSMINGYNRCRELYLETTNHRNFGIGNASSWSFTASWYGTINDENAMFVKTRDNYYCVWLDR